MTDDASLHARTEGALRREVGLLAGTLIGVNAMIGTGIFKKSAPIARDVGSVEGLLLIWLVGGIIALAGALSLAELAAAMPRTGGLYEYVRRAWGERAAFVLGYTRLVLLIPSALGSFAKLAAEAFVSFFDIDAGGAVLDSVAVLVIVVCTSVNLFGVRVSAAQQGFFTALKYVGVLVLAAAGLLLAHEAIASVPGVAPPEWGPVTPLSVFAALVAVMWAYDGWSDLSSLAGEVHDPERTLPRAFVLGTLVTTVAYLALNLAYVRVLGLEGIARSGVGANMVAANLATAIFGGTGLRVLSLLVFLSCLGASMSTLLTGPRVLVAMSADAVLPEAVGRVDERTGVPRAAVLVGAVLGVVYVLFQSFEQLTDAFVVGLFPFYMLGVAAVMRLRRLEPDLPRPFRVPLHPLPELVFLVGASATMLGALRDVTSSTGVALLIVLAGLPLSFLFRRTRASGGAVG